MPFIESSLKSTHKHNLDQYAMAIQNSWYYFFSVKVLEVKFDLEMHNCISNVDSILRIFFLYISETVTPFLLATQKQLNFTHIVASASAVGKVNYVFLYLFRTCYQAVRIKLKAIL